MAILKKIVVVVVLVGAGLAVWHRVAPEQFASTLQPVSAQLEKLGFAKTSESLGASLSSSATSISEKKETVAIQEELKTLTERGKVAVEEAQKVLGKAIEVDENSDKAAHEKALEYGKYVYCKQVVEEWEKVN